nr:MAG TPA: hypothetical protein [Caudoviricetes sp.]
MQMKPGFCGELMRLHSSASKDVLVRQSLLTAKAGQRVTPKV